MFDYTKHEQIKATLRRHLTAEQIRKLAEVLEALPQMPERTDIIGRYPKGEREALRLIRQVRATGGSPMFQR